jgi:hypothetical protein
MSNITSKHYDFEWLLSSVLGLLVAALFIATEPGSSETGLTNVTKIKQATTRTI